MSDDDDDCMVDTIGDGETFVDHIYTWYEPRFHAIKVGRGLHAEGRMVDYAAEYEFEHNHLHKIMVPAVLNVRGIETACHAELTKRGLPTIPPTRELFALGTKLSYEAAVEIVEAVINEALVDAKVALANNESVQTTYKQRLAKERAAEAAAVEAEQQARREAEQRAHEEALVRSRNAAMLEQERQQEAAAAAANKVAAERKTRRFWVWGSAIIGGFVLLICIVPNNSPSYTHAERTQDYQSAAQAVANHIGRSLTQPELTALWSECNRINCTKPDRIKQFVERVQRGIR
jgi:hypothetical protein